MSTCPAPYLYPYNKGDDCCRYKLDCYLAPLTPDSTCCRRLASIPCADDEGCIKGNCEFCIVFFVNALVFSIKFCNNCEYIFCSSWIKVVENTVGIWILNLQISEILYPVAIYNKIVTPCFASLAIRQSPYTKDTSSQHLFAPGFKG